jgi:hypothetical protein
MLRFGRISEVFMHCRVFRWWLPMVLLLGMANVAIAEKRGAPSLEWLSCSADAIVIGKIGKLTAEPGPGDVIYEDCVVDVKEVIKGDVKGKQIEFTWREIDGSQTVLPLLKARQGVVLFLAKSRDNGSEHRMDDRWVPLPNEGRPWIVDLSEAPKGVFSKEMKIISEEEVMLRIVREWAKSPVKQSLQLEVPPDSPVFKELFSGSSCFLTVPAEEKYREGFMKLARSPEAGERARAAGELAKYPGAETEAILRALLKDDAESVGYYASDEIYRVTFHVRSAAYYSLKALGQTVPEMALERKPTAEEQRVLRERAWKASFTTALKDGWSIKVADGPARVLDGRERTIVIVTCQRDKDEATFTLIPKEWPHGGADVRGKIFLGTNGPNSQGGRGFYLQGKLPEDERKAVVAYFGLQ